MRGRDKLLEEINGEPLLRRIADAARTVLPHVAVTIPHLGHPRAAALSALSVHLLDVPDWEEGMSASLRRGVKFWRGHVDGLIVTPGDMPELDARCFAIFSRDIFARTLPSILRGVTQDGEAGHPVYFPKQYFPELLALRGDQGARELLQRQAIDKVVLPGQSARRDLDTPEAWDAWRKRTL